VQWLPELSFGTTIIRNATSIEPYRQRLSRLTQRPEVTCNIPDAMDVTSAVLVAHHNMALAPLTRAILDGAQQRWIPLGMRLIWNSAFRIRSADRQPDYRQPDIRWLVKEAP
jgi:hypothetical protein